MRRASKNTECILEKLNDIYPIPKNAARDKKGNYLCKCGHRFYIDHKHMGVNEVPGACDECKCKYAKFRIR